MVSTDTETVYSLLQFISGEKRRAATPVCPLAVTDVKLSSSPENSCTSHLDSEEPYSDTKLTLAVSITPALHSENNLFDSCAGRFNMDEASDRYFTDIELEPSIFDTGSRYSSPSLCSVHSVTETQKDKQEDIVSRCEHVQ